MNKINFCYIINDYKIENSNCQLIESTYIYKDTDKYVNMMIMSLDTLFKFYYDNIDNVYILCDNMNISSEKYNFIIKSIDRLNNLYKNKIIIKNIDLIKETSFIKYPLKNCNAYKIGKSCLGKFILSKTLNCDNVFYVDCDILFNGNTYNILTENINDNILCKFFSDTDIEFPNSGFIYINCKLYNELNINDEVVNYYNTTKDIRTVDNTCWIYLFYKYKDICSININDKSKEFLINYRIDNIEAYSNKIAVIHLLGEYETDRYELFKSLYNKIMNI